MKTHAFVNHDVIYSYIILKTLYAIDIVYPARTRNNNRSCRVDLQYPVESCPKRLTHVERAGENYIFAMYTTITDFSRVFVAAEN